MSKLRIGLLIFFIATSATHAQSLFPLPLYERFKPEDFWLLRIDSLPRNVIGQFDTVTMLGYNRPVAYLTFSSFYLTHEKECCHVDSTFLIGRLNVSEVKHLLPAQDTLPPVFLLGKADHGELFDLNSTLKNFNQQKLLSEEWTKPLTYKESYHNREYRWSADSSGVYWQTRDKREFTNEYDRNTFHVDLSQCKYFRQDSIEVLYTTPGESALKIQEPSWTIIYVNGKLLDAMRDFSGTTMDGYGPFHYQPQKLIGWYNTKKAIALLFSPGYVICNKDGKWYYANREAVKYYGECDCDE